MKNVGVPATAAPSRAACFLQRFVNNGVPWAHLDIAGTAWSSKDAPTIPKGATAYGVRLLDRLGGRALRRWPASHADDERNRLLSSDPHHAPSRPSPSLLGRTLAAGQRAAVLCGSGARLKALDDALWASSDPDWLPHGSPRSGEADLQPIWLTTVAEAPNGARYLFRLDGTDADAAGWDRVFDLFDGADETAVAAARQRWAAAKQAGHTLTYWQQGERGWQKKA